MNRSCDTSTGTVKKVTILLAIIKPNELYSLKILAIALIN
jgi:hypothetical protein